MMNGGGKVGKRIGLIVLASAMTISALAACSGNQTAPGASTGTPSAAQGAEEGKEPYSFSLMLSTENWNYVRELKADDPYTNELKRLTGVEVKYNFYEVADLSTILTTRFASKEMPDVFQLNGGGITNSLVDTAIDGGAFMDLTALLQKYGQNILKAFPEDTWKSPQISKNGKIYGIPKMSALPATKGMFIRQDYLDKLNMKTPETLDDYLAFFEAVKTTDLNGNGKNDEIPLAVSQELGGYNWVFEGYFNAFPGAWRWMNGQAAPDLISPNMKELVAFEKQLYDKGYVNRDMFTAKLADRAGFIKANPVGAFAHDAQQSGGVGGYGDPTWYTQEGATGKGPQVDFLNGPTTKEGTKRFSTLGTGFTNVYVINAKVKNPEEIIKYYDWMLSGRPEANNFFAYGVEGRNYTVKDGKIVWDKTAEPSKSEAVMHQFMLGIRDWRVSDEVIATDPQAERVKRAKKLAVEAAVDTGMFKYMPTLPTMTKNPQLGSGDGSLWADMYAKVVLGREPIDTAFDRFVKAWKAQGGDQLIKEATDWYKANNK